MRETLAENRVFIEEYLIHSKKKTFSGIAVFTVLMLIMYVVIECFADPFSVVIFGAF